MSQMLEKFADKIKKFRDYYLLRKEEDYLIIGVNIIIQEHKTIMGNVFQPFSKNIEREIWVFFLVINGEKSLEITKDFIKRKIPILNLAHTKVFFKAKDIREMLFDFIKERFYL